MLALVAASGCRGVERERPTVPTTETATAATRPLEGDQAEVIGTVTRVVGTQVAGPVLSLPVSLSVTRGGGTKATITGGRVGGRDQTVAWDGGRPLPISGMGSLDLAGPADVEVSAIGTAWLLDESARTLTTGNYRLGATVAVGSTGLASPQDGVTVAVSGTAALSTKGGVRAVIARARTTLSGPGRLVLEGDLTLRTRAGTTPTGLVRFGPGPFELTLEPRPEGGGYTVSRALLQGPVTAGG